MDPGASSPSVSPCEGLKAPWTSSNTKLYPPTFLVSSATLISTARPPGEGWEKWNCSPRSQSFLSHCLCCFLPLPVLVSSLSYQLYPDFRCHWKSLSCYYLDHGNISESSNVKHGGSGTMPSHKYQLLHTLFQVKIIAANQNTAFLPGSY